jgi:CRISPR-associated protein Cas5d
MTGKISRSLSARVRGPLACFTRPEMKVERVSYEVMTPSAARGVLEAVLWKPAIAWRVESIAVLAPIAWTSFRRNEVKDRASPNVPLFFSDTPDRRAQRNTVALRDVDYVVTATLALTDRAGPEESVVKFEEMFERRVAKGQHFHQPYLGCREFAADVEPAPERITPVEANVERPLGLVLYDFEYGGDGRGARPLFFEARLTSGVLRVPPRSTVLEQNGVLGGREP